MWVMILGITTVGYGDIIPITHISRLIVYAGCFMGNIILILMTVAIFNVISHNEKELEAYEFIENFENRYELRNCAACVIQRYVKYNSHFSKERSSKRGSQSFRNTSIEEPSA